MAGQLRLVVHNLTHRHPTVNRCAVGSVSMCLRRGIWPGLGEKLMAATIIPHGHQGDDPALWRLDCPDPDDLMAVAQTTTADELREVFHRLKSEELRRDSAIACRTYSR